MKTIINVLMTIACLMLLGSQCKDDMDCRLSIVNNSNEIIWFDIDCYNYPDSLLWVGNCNEKKLGPYSSGEICNNQNWEDVFLSNNIEGLKIYAINYDTALLYDIKTIIKNEKYYKLYTPSLEDLNNQNWTITYP